MTIVFVVVTALAVAAIGLVIVGRVTAERYGFKVGDRVPIIGAIYPGNWDFTVRGIYKGTRKSDDETQFWFRWDHLQEKVPEFARNYARLEAARVKVRESLDRKVRTSKFSMDFWKETHDRLVVNLDTVRKENETVRARLSAATGALQQSADAAGALLGREKLIAPATLDAHRKALEAVPLAKGA